MTFRNHTWTYDQVASGPAGYSVFTTLHPPQGPGTTYEYNGGELTAIHSPFGGTIAYTYARRGASRRLAVDDDPRRHDTVDVGTQRARRSTWTFAYSTGSNQDTTVIACPCGGVTKYRFNGTGLSGDFAGWVPARWPNCRSRTAALFSSRGRWRGAGASQSRTIPCPAPTVCGATMPSTVRYCSARPSRAVRNMDHELTYHTGQGNFNDYGNAYYIDEYREHLSLAAYDADVPVRLHPVPARRDRLAVDRTGTAPTVRTTGRRGRRRPTMRRRASSPARRPWA